MSGIFILNLTFVLVYTILELEIKKIRRKMKQKHFTCKCDDKQNKKVRKQLNKIAGKTKESHIEIIIRKTGDEK